MRVGGWFEAGLESWLETQVEGQHEGSASRKLLKLADSEDARTGGYGILIDGLPAMQGSVEVRGASKAQPEVEAQGASRVNRNR
jgi:hypothetical protein